MKYRGDVGEPKETNLEKKTAMLVSYSKKYQKLTAVHTHNLKSCDMHLRIALFFFFSFQ